MIERPDLTIAPEILVKYIEYLEGCLNGSSELILALNTVSRVFATDINLMCDGEAIEWVAEGETDVAKSKLTFLSGDAKDKTFERLMVLFDKFDKIKALSQHFKGTTNAASDQSKVKMKPGGNIYEHVLDEVKNGRSRI